MSRSQTTEGAQGKRRFAKSEAGFALLIVVLTIAALALLLTPFMLSMRLQEKGSRNAVAQTRSRYAVTAAYNHALAQLLRARTLYDVDCFTRVYGRPLMPREIRGAIEQKMQELG